jgi:hypothetical protein
MEAPGCEPLITKTKLRKMTDDGWGKVSDDANDGRFILLRKGQTESILITHSGMFSIFNGDIDEIETLPTAPKKYGR